MNENIETTENPKTHPHGNAEKDPSDWVTKDEPMTGAQASYLKTLCEEKGAEFDSSLRKGEASARIDELKQKPELNQTTTSKSSQNEISEPEVPGF